MRSKRAFRQRGQAMLAWVLAFAIAVLGCFGFAPSTPRGLQCPTASVQEVTVVAYVKTCCGKLVPVTVKRAPREGEAGFKQCQCAEKKASEKDDQAKSAEHRAAPSMLPLQAFGGSLPFPLTIPYQGASEPKQAQTAICAYSPPTPPPQSI